MKVQLELHPDDVYMICYHLSDTAADHEQVAFDYPNYADALKRRAKVFNDLSKAIAKQAKAELKPPVEHGQADLQQPIQ